MTVVILALASIAFSLAFFNLFLFIRNLFLYAPPPAFSPKTPLPAVSVLIPARNEEASIRAAVLSALASKGVELEIIVLDDHSDDRTGDIVYSLQQEDRRVRLERAPALPPGWCGKQFACAVLADLASHDLLCFMDSDVRLQPEGLARTVAFLRKSGAGLVSGFPHQRLGTFFEKLLLPLMHFLLLSFLPIDFMRSMRNPSLGAGCGQIFVTDKNAYEMAGGHGAIRSSRHDGIKLPRAFRQSGLHTDICDMTDVAECRMYHNAEEVFSGLLKNANEGIAAPIRIVVFTVLLLGGHVLPEIILGVALYQHRFGQVFVLSLLATICSLATRVLASIRFRQPLGVALLHPFAMIVFLCLQWNARFRDLTGRPAVWKGRTYQTT